MPFAHTTRARNGTRGRARGGFRIPGRRRRVVVGGASGYYRSDLKYHNRPKTKRALPHRDTATSGVSERSESGGLRTCLVAFSRCAAAAAGRPGGCGHFPCLGRICNTPGRALNRTVRTLHRAPVGQGPPGPGWLAISFGFWSGRALATGTAWAGLRLIQHHKLNRGTLHRAPVGQGLLPPRPARAFGF